MAEAGRSSVACRNLAIAAGWVAARMIVGVAVEAVAGVVGTVDSGSAAIGFGGRRS